MPQKPAHDPTYGYDPETNTVRVGQHDPARLLLIFRSLMREQKPGSWGHMRDYDLSFERLADAVDASSQIRYGKRWTGPDLRMRCTTTEPVYDWPEGAPYDGEATFTWMVPGYGSHASEDDQVDLYSNTALCGWLCSPERTADVHHFGRHPAWRLFEFAADIQGCTCDRYEGEHCYGSHAHIRR
ncbi:hypothetical protein [Streptomyces werraensis]|uniref:hypothetical protein n=1 Tax=Streptomyces werraensis TaxID=68284 RepID=UPI003426779B